MKKVTGYEVDGKIFDTKKEALAHQARANLDRIAATYDGDGVAGWMIEQGWPLINMLSDIARRSGAAKPTD